MDLLERAKQKLGESKKIPDKEITPDNQEKKITPGRKDVDPQPKKLQKSNLTVKQTDSKTISKSELIDKKINEFELRIDQKFNEFNERLLKLLNIGVKHELTIENLMKYLKTHERKTKLYKLADYFSEANLSEIENMLKYLHSTGVIKKDKNNWYSLK